VRLVWPIWIEELHNGQVPTTGVGVPFELWSSVMPEFELDEFPFLFQRVEEPLRESQDVRHNSGF